MSRHRQVLSALGAGGLRRRGSSAVCESCCSLSGRDRGGCSGISAIPFQGIMLSQNKTYAIPL